MKKQLAVCILPALWAQYLVNGCSSGLTQETRKDIMRFLQSENLKSANCIDCSNDVFIMKYDGLLTECLEYTFIIL